jgi:hypothetical protein
MVSTSIDKSILFTHATFIMLRHSGAFMHAKNDVTQLVMNSDEFIESVKITPYNQMGRQLFQRPQLNQYIHVGAGNTVDVR